jgi:hypothetical protein
MDGLDVAAAERLLDRLESAPTPMTMAQLRPLGGAVARVPDDATAYAHRTRRVMANIVALHDPAADREPYQEWVIRVAGELAGARPGAYVNFLGDEGEERVREAYPGAAWNRLAEVKQRWDPYNVFRLNQNVAPGDD